MTHSALTKGAVAVVTGGASGIGLAASKRLAELGLRVCIADRDADRIAHAVKDIAGSTPNGAQDVFGFETDVSDIDDVQRLHAAVIERFGGVDVLMNNAGIQPGSGVFGPAENWTRVLGVNLWGAIH